jgi:hypothetical protein
VVSSADSPEAFRRVDERLSTALPNAEHVVVEAGTRSTRAHLVVMSFIERNAV